jgi:hypothetical protein
MRKLPVAVIAIAIAAACALASCAASGPTAAQIARHKAYEARKSAYDRQLAARKVIRSAIMDAVRNECEAGHTIAGQVNAATTVGDFDAGWQIWQSELTAAMAVSTAGVPTGRNDSNLIQKDFAEANLFIVIGSQYSDVFSGYDKNKLINAYSMAQSSLQDMLNRCAQDGD